MARSWPALDVCDVGNADALLAILDDFLPTAVEERESGLRVFFATTETRDAALAALADARAAAVEVSDEDWARRSQEGLAPVTVGRITIFPNSESRIPNPDAIQLVIPPSMAFGTGHHATTRLCLAGLQTIELPGKFVLDIGTGSGILAIAAVALGAAAAFGLDNDLDAIAAARENLALNPGKGPIEFMVGDLHELAPGDVHVVTANLTGALFVREAGAVARALRARGVVIASGLLAGEAPDVLAAFQPMKKVWQAEEDGWIGVILMKE